jgi:putative tricarboxylic transport membrane protein
VILGPSAEEQMRRALQLTNGDVAGLYNTWFSKAVYAVILLVLVVPPIVRRVRGNRGTADGGGLAAATHANQEGQ